MNHEFKTSYDCYVTNVFVSLCNIQPKNYRQSIAIKVRYKSFINVSHRTLLVFFLLFYFFMGQSSIRQSSAINIYQQYLIYTHYQDR